ncbi:MAG TPA: hypothetical protein VJC04_02685 [Candidatus Paceibacterota bacterium]
MNQKGFINILLIIIVVALVGAGAYFVSTKQITPPNPISIPTPSPTPTPTPSPTPSTSTQITNRGMKVKVVLTGPLQVIQHNFQGKEVVLDNMGNLQAGNRIGIVRNPFGEPSEVASIDVLFLHDQIRKAKENQQESFTSAVLTIDLPTNSTGGEYLIIYYLDNGNRKFDKGESFESSWTGGRDTFELQFLEATSEEKTKLGGHKGWNIVEGGFPQRYTQDFNNSIIRIEPKPRIIID